MNFDARRGVIYGVAAYGLWGVFPLYFRLIERSGAVEIVMHRVLWSLLVCLIVVWATRGGDAVAAVLRTPRRAAGLGIAALVLALNWGIYIYAVNSGQVVEASLGYFINPIVTVLLGVLVLRERLRPLQWAAVAAGSIAVAVLTIDYGRLPYIAFALAGSFATYGLIKNRVGATVGAVASLTTETLLMAPFAALGLTWIEVTHRGTFSEPWQGLLLASVGVATVVPLLFFAAAARRVPLSTIGLLQYITPVLQLMCGVLLLGERMPASRWAGFGLVWLALAMLTIDSLQAVRARREWTVVPQCEICDDVAEVSGAQLDAAEDRRHQMTTLD